MAPVLSLLYQTYRLLLSSLGTLVFSAILASVSAAERSYFDNLKACGGRAEIMHMSDGRSFRYCPPGRGCKTTTVYRYEVRCGNGRIYSAPAIYYRQSRRVQKLRLQGDVLAAYLGHKQRKERNPKRECVKRVSDYSCPNNPDCYQILCLGKKWITKREAVWTTLPAGHAPLPEGAKIVRVGSPPKQAKTVTTPVRQVTPTRRTTSEASMGVPVFIWLLLLGGSVLALFKWRAIVTWMYMHGAPDPTSRIVDDALEAGMPMDGPELAAAMRSAAERREPSFVTEARIRRAKREAERAKTMAEFADTAVRYSRARNAQQREHEA